MEDQKKRYIIGKFAEILSFFSTVYFTLLFRPTFFSSLFAQQIDIREINHSATAIWWKLKRKIYRCAIISHTWSHILSGCPSETDSEVNRNVSASAIVFSNTNCLRTTPAKMWKFSSECWWSQKARVILIQRWGGGVHSLCSIDTRCTCFEKWMRSTIPNSFFLPATTC